MNLAAEICLSGIGKTLTERVMPVLDDRFALEAVRLASLLLAITTNSFDNAAEIRVTENGAMRALFGNALPVVADGGLAVNLAKAARSFDPSLKISELDAENARLRGVLVELHCYVEAQDSEEYRAIDRQIWRMLADFEAARAPRR